MLPKLYAIKTVIRNKVRNPKVTTLKDYNDYHRANWIILVHKLSFFPLTLGLKYFAVLIYKSNNFRAAIDVIYVTILKYHTEVLRSY